MIQGNKTGVILFKIKDQIFIIWGSTTENNQHSQPQEWLRKDSHLGTSPTSCQRLVSDLCFK